MQNDSSHNIQQPRKDLNRNKRQQHHETPDALLQPRISLYSSKRESISIVIPLYNEEESIIPLSEQITTEATALVGND